MSEFEFVLAPPFVGKLSLFELAAKLSTGTLIADVRPDAEAVLWRFRVPGFFFEVALLAGHLVVTRNSQQARTPMIPSDSAGPTRGRCLVFATWNVDYIKATVNTTHVRVDTPPTIPPNALLHYLREINRIPVQQYATRSLAVQTLLDAFAGLQDRIDTAGMQSAFWDVQRNGAKITSRQPKLEREIHPTLHALLYEVAAVKSLEVHPEARSGSGTMDFLFRFQRIDDTFGDICVEVKRAHASDLKHGLIEQLPAYMRSRGSDDAIYVVLDFRGKDWSDPPGISLPSDLISICHQHRLAGVRVVRLDVGFKQPPSHA